MSTSRDPTLPLQEAITVFEALRQYHSRLFMPSATRRRDYPCEMRCFDKLDGDKTCVEETKRLLFFSYFFTCAINTTVFCPPLAYGCWAARRNNTHVRNVCYGTVHKPLESEQIAAERWLCALIRLPDWKRVSWNIITILEQISIFSIFIFWSARALFWGWSRNCCNTLDVPSCLKMYLSLKMLLSPLVMDFSPCEAVEMDMRVFKVVVLAI